MCLWIFFFQRSSLSILRGREREGETQPCAGAKALGAGETESSHQAPLATMGMLYIVIHFLSTFPLFLFRMTPRGRISAEPLIVDNKHNQ